MYETEEFLVSMTKDSKALDKPFFISLILLNRELQYEKRNELH